MRLRTLFTIVVASAAFALVPSAFAMSDASDRAEAVMPDAFERAVAAQLRSSTGPANYPDAFERAVAAHERSATGVSIYPDAFERAALQATKSGPLPGHVDRYEIDLPRGPVGSPTIDRGRDVEWPQIGIGLALGFILALGVYVTLRLTRTRELAH